MYSIIKSKVLNLFLTVCMVGALVSIPNVEVQATVATNTVISEVYGGCTNSDANFKNDFVGVGKVNDCKEKTTSIAEVRNLEIGTTVRTKGIITFKEVSESSFNYAIEDGTAGIALRGNDELAIGDEVIVEGKIDEYKGLKEIQYSSVQIKSFNNELPLAKDINIVDIINNDGGENVESQRVKISGAIIGEIKSTGNTTLVDDNGNIINIYKIPEIIDIKEGDKVDVIGVCSQSNSYQIRVAQASDIKISESEDIEKVDAEDTEEAVVTVSTPDSLSTTITILHTNDSHGRVKAGWGTIGIDKIATFKDEIENSLLVDAGDTLHGLPFATLNRGEDIVNLMKLAGYDLMTPGNHDFNYSYERLLELADLANQGENGFEIISANVLKDGNTILPAISIKEVDGVKIGFFGLSTPETTYKTNPNNVKDLEFIDPIETARAQVEALEEEGVDVIIALAHIGTDISSDVQSTMIAEEVAGIDVIVDGHSHSVYEDGYEAANDTLIVSAGEHEKNLGKLELVINKETKEVESKKASLLNEEDFTEVTPDADVTAGIEAIDAEQSIVLDEVIGNTLVTLDGEREQVRAGETNLGNLIADAMIYESGADIAITNGGGIRASIDAGEITRGEIITTLPFGNYIVTKKLTGAEIKEVLEHGVQSYPETLGAFTHVAGLSFMFDDTKPAGERIVKITINGQDMDMSKEYTVATNDFIAIGGDGYPCFANKNIENEFKGLDEALAAFVKHLGDVNYKVEGRITVGKENVEVTPEPDKDEDTNTEDDGNKDEDTDKDNDKEDGKGTLPNTGGTDVTWLYILGVILIVTGVIVIFKRKKVNGDTSVVEDDIIVEEKIDEEDKNKE